MNLINKKINNLKFKIKFSSLIFSRKIKKLKVQPIQWPISIEVGAERGNPVKRPLFSWIDRTTAETKFQPHHDPQRVITTPYLKIKA